MTDEVDILTYDYTGGNVINDQANEKEGVTLHLRKKGETLDIYLDKRSAAHVVQLVQTGRRYWKRFRLPKMIEQQRRYCRRCKRYTPHNKIAGKWSCIQHA